MQVVGQAGALALAAGRYHSLGLKEDGTVWAWGGNPHGQLGNGTNVSSNVPVQVSGLTGVVAIAAGWYHSMAVKDDGTVWAWDSTRWASWAMAPAPTRICCPRAGERAYGVTSVAGWTSCYHSLPLKNDGTVWGWGFVSPASWATEPMPTAAFPVAKSC